MVRGEVIANLFEISVPGRARAEMGWVLGYKELRAGTFVSDEFIWDWTIVLAMAHNLSPIP